MKISFKCLCGAEFVGEDSGTAYSMMTRADNWQQIHKACIDKQKQPKREPLTDEQIEMIWTVDQTSADDCASLYYAKVIARAIEAAHGIKGAA